MLFQINILKAGKKSALHTTAFSHDVNLPALFWKWPWKYGYRAKKIV